MATKTKLKDIEITKVALVPIGANPDAQIMLYKAGQTKRENGQDFPASAFAYVPDPESPSTWKLRLIESPGEKPTAAQVGRAVAALGPGDFVVIACASRLQTWLESKPKCERHGIRRMTARLRPCQVF